MRRATHSRVAAAPDAQFASYTRTVTVQRQPLIGSTIDARYRVDAFVARGGMATVYRATDLRLDRTVALKVMHGSLAADQDFVTRFVREARAAAQLSNPSTVAVFDQGEADGFVYLAMEYVDGQTLRDILKQRGRLNAREALAVLEPVLDALQAAHTGGFAHRDIKPENVLISTDGRVKVADFGLARAIVTTSETGLTQGLLIGTVAYLAPEQVERGVADARTDVYSAGVVLYECLVGQTPFTGETPMSIAYQHVHATMPRASEIRTDIPADVDELVRNATSRDPEDRYLDAADFLAHLRAVRARLTNNTTNPPSDAPSANRTVVLDRADATVAVGPWPTPIQPPPGQPPLDESPAVGGADSPFAITQALVTGVAAADLAAGSGAAALDAASAANQTAKLPSPPNPAVGLQGPPGGPWVTRDTEGPATDSTPAKTVPSASTPPPPPPPAPTLAATTIQPLPYAPASHPAATAATSSAQSASVAGTTPPLPPQTTDDDAAPRRPRRFRVLAAVLVLVLIAASVGVGAWAYTRAQLVSMPSVVGMTPEAAKDSLAATDLQLSVEGEDFSTTVPKGAILSTNPTAGATMKRGETVLARTSAGPQMVKVPKLAGQRQAKAEESLRALGFPFTVSEEYSTAVADGLVISSAPKSGKSVQVGTPVELVVSKGPPPVTVPDVLRMDKDSAVARLKALGLKVSVRNQLPIVVVGRVYSQDPAPGTVVPMGSTVTITLV